MTIPVDLAAPVTITLDDAVRILAAASGQRCTPDEQAALIHLAHAIEAATGGRLRPTLLDDPPAEWQQ